MIKKNKISIINRPYWPLEELFEHIITKYNGDGILGNENYIYTYIPFMDISNFDISKLSIVGVK